MKLPSARLCAAVVLVAFSIIFVVAMASGVGRAGANDRDFLAYWAAGKQLVHRENPYDAKQVLQVEQEVGFTGAKPNMMLNWPIAFFLTFPLGFISAQTGMAIWILLVVACLIASIRLLGRSLQIQDWIYLSGYVFAPVLACVMAGQLGTIMLLGISVFLCFHRTRPGGAGAALILCALKPHLFIPFALVLLIWVLRERAVRMAAGASAAALGSMLFAWVLDPVAWKQYAEMMRGTAEIQQDFIPCISQFFRLVLNSHAVWLQFVPVVIGSFWALGYYWKKRKCWSWETDGLLLLLVSVLVAPHSWFTDEVLVLPALLTSLYRAKSANRSLVPFFILGGIALVEVLAQVQLTSAWYAWSVPAWLLLYLYGNQRRDLQTTNQGFGMQEPQC